MIQGTTKSGFNYSIDDDALDDQELLDAFMDMDNGNLSAYRDAIIRLLGKEQKERLYDYLRDNGSKRVSAKAVAETFAEILGDASERSSAAKN